MFSTILAASAYENGRTAGALFLVVFAAALVHRYLVRDRLPGAAGVLAVSVVALIAGIVVVKASSHRHTEKLRASMVAGCQASAGPAASICGCMIDELLERTGTSDEAIDRLNIRMQNWQVSGGTPPVEFTEAATICARRAGLTG